MEASRRHQISRVRYKVLYCSQHCKRHLHQFLPPCPRSHRRAVGQPRDAGPTALSLSRETLSTPAYTLSWRELLPSHTAQYTTRPLTAGDTVSIFPCSRQRQPKRKAARTSVPKTGKPLRDPGDSASQQWDGDEANANITFIWRFFLGTHQADLYFLKVLIKKEVGNWEA